MPENRKPMQFYLCKPKGGRCLGYPTEDGSEILNPCNRKQPAFNAWYCW